MPTEKEPANNQSVNSEKNPATTQSAYENDQAFFAADDRENAPIHQTDNDVATNDGTVIETLDTAFHNKPGFNQGATEAGSNRADYYESRSYGKTDAEEELEARKKEGSE